MAGTNNLLLILVRWPGVFLGEKVKVCLAHRLGRVVQAERLGVRLTDSDEAAFPILEVDIVRNAIHQGVHEVLLTCQCLFGLLAVDGDGDLAAQTFQQQPIVIAECPGPIALHVEDAQHLVTQFDGHRQLAFGVRQMGIGAPVFSLGHIGGQNRLTIRRRRANHPAAHGQLVLIGEQALTDLPIAGYQHDGVAHWIVAEDLRMVVVEAFLDERDDSLEEFVQIRGSGNFLRYFRAGSNLLFPQFKRFSHALLQLLAFSDVVHGGLQHLLAAILEG